MLFGRRRAGSDRLNRVDDILAEWIAWSLSTDPADRPAAERAIAGLYRLHGLAPPTFVWVDSPVTGVLAGWILSGAKPVRPRLGKRVPSLRSILADPMWDRIGPAYRDSALASVTAALGDRVRLDDPPRDRLGPPLRSGLTFRASLLTVPDASRVAAVRARARARGRLPVTLWDVRFLSRLPLGLDVVLDASYRTGLSDPERAALEEAAPASRATSVQRLIDRGCFQVLRPADDVRGLSPWPEIPPSFTAGTLERTSQFSAPWLGRADVCRRLGLVRYTRTVDAMLDLLAAAVRSCGAWWPHPEICVVAERPVRYRADRPHRHAPRPHGAEGPALEWRDGWALHAWRGVPVSRELIAGEVTRLDWLREPNAEVRRAIVERMGYAWLLDNATSRMIATDDYGTLWWILDPHDLLGILLVDVVNSTPEPDGSVKRYLLRVPPDQTVPRDAIGWTFGLAPGEYGPMTMT